MNLTQIEFSQATSLTEATKWVYDPDKDITPGAALQHCLLKQETGEIVTVTAYGTLKTWFQRRANGRGVIDTSYLFDAEDLISRVSRQDIWKKNALCVTQNKTNSMKLDCVQGVDANNKTISAGNINISTYAGDLAEFKVPSAAAYKTVSTCKRGFDFKAATKTCSNFSGLRGDTANRIVWFVLTVDGIRINVTERGSNRGIGLLTHFVEAEGEHDIRFGIYGRHLLKVSDVMEESAAIEIKVDDLEKPTRVRFSGDKGWIDLATVQDYYCRALSQGAMGIFLKENYSVERKCSKTFDVDELMNGVSIQTPKKGANRNDVVLEMVDQVLKVSKRSDIRCSEVSSIPCAVLENSEWMPVVVDHTYLTDAIEALDAFITRNENKSETMSFEFKEDLEDEEEQSTTEVTQNTKRYVSLTQAFNKKFNMWLIYVEPLAEGEYSECRSALIVNTKESTNDFNEAD